MANNKKIPTIYEYAAAVENLKYLLIYFMVSY